VNDAQTADGAPGTLPSASSSPLSEILAQAVPLIDLRSPSEAARGAIPGAVNMPILEDAERAEVGTTYKHAGQAEAIRKGNQLVEGGLKEQRIARWLGYIEDHPGAQLFCWRGGLRSSTAQDWLSQAGVEVPRIAGGYKALRNTCLDVLGEAPDRKRWLVIGGRTGSGKTRLLTATPLAIDLEGLANHRGSAFGAQETPQPELASFENALAVNCLRHPGETLVVEDESRTIGRLALPATWHERMQTAPLLILDVDIDQRCINIQREYVDEVLERGVSAADLKDRFTQALERIRRRLGGLRHAQVQQSLNRAFDNGDHTAWIEQLLTWYYDPMYDYQLSKKHARVIATGDEATLLEHLQTLN
jgi:tRNA 2-selenouridine synthase